MLHYNYNRAVNPPAPFVHVTLARTGPATGAAGEWPAKIDTGADTTVIPLAAVNALGLVQISRVSATGFAGVVTEVGVYPVLLSLRGIPPVPLAVLAVDREEYALLGRDVLNRHRIVLDGPNLAIDIE